MSNYSQIVSLLTNNNQEKTDGQNQTQPEKPFYHRQISEGRQIVTAMTNNASFPNPNPPLTEITTALDELTQAFALVQAAKSEVLTRVVTQENAEAQLDQGLTKLAAYVESVAGTDHSLITSAGMETKASRSAIRVRH